MSWWRKPKPKPVDWRHVASGLADMLTSARRKLDQADALRIEIAELKKRIAEMTVEMDDLHNRDNAARARVAELEGLFTKMREVVE